MKSIKGIESLPATLRRFCEKQADKIDRVSNERAENGVYWIILADGWFNAEAATCSIQEPTVTACIAAFNDYVLPRGQSLKPGGPTGPC